MKKSALLAMPKLTATPEMKQAAIADEPKQHEGPYGYRYVERTYYPYMNCVVQDGILKAAFYLPEHLRLDGNNPAYEVFLDKKAHQFLTYDHLEKKWRDAKLDRLNWPGRNYYATCWASEKDAAVVALATQKAEELDAVAVLSNQYRGCYPSGRYVSAPIYIYISKSKNGRQYLDSLGGAAVTLAEEQYKQESFFVERAALDRAHAA